MAHCEKFKICDAKKILNEMTRESDYYKNDVDFSKINLDYQIYGDITKPIMQNASNIIADNMHMRINQLDYKQRKDTIGLCNWIVTCPEEFKNDKQKQDEFFQVVYTYTSERYGVNNVLHGVVHNDEATPHMHIPVIPVVKGKNKGDNDRLNAKEFLTRAELHNYQADLEKECEKAFKIKGLILNGRTKGDYTLEELKERTKQEQERNAKDLELITRENTLRASEMALRERENDLIEREKEIQKQEQEIKQRYIALGQTERLVRANNIVKPIQDTQAQQTSDKSRFSCF